jgi:hypothetical protein
MLPADYRKPSTAHTSSCDCVAWMRFVNTQLSPTRLQLDQDYFAVRRFSSIRFLLDQVTGVSRRSVTAFARNDTDGARTP